MAGEFETPSISLTGNISANVLDFGATPTTIIKAGDPWAVDVKWEMTGPNWHMVAGTWHVHLNLESIGPGPELSLVDFADPNCQNQALPSTDGKYSCRFDVPGTVINTGVVQHQSLPMKLVVLLTYVDPLGHRGPIAAYYEGPIVQFYEDHP
ncbi:MAG: hypothetical protein H6659_08485 [Ardenticatenaceae bacterium]|nr:hypothetical protein [Ardenticatenaceae bacterium]MCB8986599.1 hypothetical protein [Ardenticatenaceae bacterium]